MSDETNPRVIIRQRPGGEDEMGNPVVSAEPPVRYDNCTVYPRGSVEDAGRSATVVTGYTALIEDPSVDILATDELVWLGDTYTVEGKPGKWFHLDQSFAGLQVALKMGED